MYTILVAGAGQLGSRHLQGVKMSNKELDIWVYDLSEASLKVAEERYNQIESSTLKDVHFVTSLDDVPTDIDVVIIASSSKPRYSIVTQLLASHNVKYLVLEKFLFPRLSDYSEIAQLLVEKGGKAWVNCPRRMWESYSYIKKLIDPSKPIEFFYEGGDWGMCCNTIHFADIFMYLTGEESFTCDLANLKQEVVDSKRPGYVEIHGEEKFYTPSGSVLKLVSVEGADNPALSVIKNGDNRIDFYEGKGDVVVNGVLKNFPVQYQSTLTGKLVDELISTGKCNLSTYEHSSVYHVAYLNKIAPFINKIKGWTSDSCPIT